MITILYFSPTGNAAYAAERFSKSLGDRERELLALEDTEPSDLKQADQLVLMYSIHGFNPPRTVKRFVADIPSGLYRHVSILSVGCADSWVNDAASSDLRKQFRNKGYSILVDTVIAMPLTFIMAFPEDYSRKLISAMESGMEGIARLVRDEIATEKRIAPKSRIIHFIGKAEGPAAKLFGLELKAGRSCTSCGICVRRCPEKNIRFSGKNIPLFGFSCLMCMRCIYNCPEKAIRPRFSRFIPIKKGYDIENLKQLKEI